MSKRKNVAHIRAWRSARVEDHLASGVLRFISSRLSALCLSIAFIAISAASATANGRFVLEKVFHGQSGNDHTPISWDVIDGSYVASFSSVYRSGCVGSYRVMFAFDRDIRVIPDGGQFQVAMQKLSGHTPCGFKQSGATVLGPNDIFTSVSPEFPSDYERNGNMSTTRNSIGMWDGSTQQMTAVVTARAKKNTPYTAFALNVRGPIQTNYLIFLYRYEKAALPASASSLENDIDRPGQDYRSFFQAQADPSICQAACVNEGRCRAWTWVRPGLQGAQSKCWLKYSIPVAQRSDCCVSGTKLVKQ